MESHLASVAWSGLFQDWGEQDKPLHRSDWENWRSHWKAKKAQYQMHRPHWDNESQQDDVRPYPNHSAWQQRYLEKRMHQSTWPISGSYPRPSLDTNLLWKRSINTFCVRCATFQKIHTATRADFPLLTEDCKTAHLSELKDWHVWISENPVLPTPIA